MSEERDGLHTGVTRSIWLLLCKEGGRWTPREIADHLQMDFDSVSQTLHRMNAIGTARKFQLPERRNGVAFGVTAACKVAQGVTIAELAALGCITVAEDDEEVVA